jgi:transcriptional regulator with XRE-family HTH domain
MTAEDDLEFYGRLGDRLREQRRAKGVTQEALANLLGLNRTTVVNLEKGRQRLAVHQLVLIADHLGCEPGDLLPRLAADDHELSAKLRKKAQDGRALSFVSEVAAAARTAR